MDLKSATQIQKYGAKRNDLKLPLENHPCL